MCMSALVLALASARAEPVPVAASRPWMAGVSEVEQSIALRFYEEGNIAFLESRFTQALAKYREAIKYWDHPAIRFNMAVCLINLEQLVEAKQNLERGLAYGPAPLGDEVHLQGLTYRKLLDAQLTSLTIICEEPEAGVALDGKGLFMGPGEVTQYVLAGEHQVVGTKPGFLTSSVTLTLAPGRSVIFNVRLVALEPATLMIRRWPRRTPYAMLVTGGVVAGLGVLAYAASAGNFAAYDDGIRSRCPNGCDAAGVAALPALIKTKERAETQQTAAFSMFALGGAVLATGAVMLYLNQPRPKLAPARPTAAMAPMAGGAALTLRWGF